MRNKGRWTDAELCFLEHLVSCYLAGILDDDGGKRLTLRQYVARELQCDPMRVTKRLKKGKVFARTRLRANFNRRVYRKLDDFTPADVDRLMALRDARNRFLVALEHKMCKETKATRGYLTIQETLNAADEDNLELEAKAMLQLRGEGYWTV
ncbi:hypothetical protein ACHHYP_16336 [Achlya hypogyna]|uniref:Uncharacterized protein n=1 Tax=Achlya hypogyna TaxID=1202772 RepID=A0A1V9Y974_ACHHY|nr:hypothetical protein ACHHYP_16336 [Achlya hypogyna]